MTIRVRTNEKSFGVLHEGQKDTTGMNVQNSHSIWQQEFQVCYQQEDYGAKSARNQVMIHITAR
jgi:hypothetical protein